MENYVEKIKVDNAEHLSRILGSFDENLTLIIRETHSVIFVDGDEICFSGDKSSVEIAKRVVVELLEIVASGETIDKARIIYLIELAKERGDFDYKSLMSGVIAITSRGKPIKCKTLGQKAYVDAIKNNTICFGVGPAGTGKTYLAVAMAVASFKAKEIEKIVLTRPAVEAGERLGFLPGDLQSKVDPYLRPLYDALQEMFGLETYQKLMEKGAIEIAPLAYMRGRTLNNSFIILDEAQNTTKEQMKMFLTRMGDGSKVIVTGDVTQIDLPEGKASGLKHAIKVLEKVDDIAIMRLTHKDVVRHPLVMEIIKAYTLDEEKKKP